MKFTMTIHHAKGEPDRTVMGIPALPGRIRKPPMAGNVADFHV
jgi:hypothetical protein